MILKMNEKVVYLKDHKFFHFDNFLAVNSIENKMAKPSKMHEH